MPSPTEHSDEQWVSVSRSEADTVATANVRDEHELQLDEPEWIPGGNDAAPWPSNYLLVACAGCQVEVITQAFEKARIDEYEIEVEARFETEDLGPELPEYPDHLSWRYTTIIMDVEVETTEANEEKVSRLLELAQDACIVSRSVERGIGFQIDQRLTVLTGGD